MQKSPLRTIPFRVACFLILIGTGAATPLFSDWAKAAVYYVDVNGSDSQDGTLEDPWNTVSFAAGRVAAGDTVLINPGTYLVTEQISITASGEEGRPITFSGNGEGAFLDLTGFAGRNGFEIFFADHIVIENLTVRASLDGSSRGIRLTHANHVTVKNNVVYGARHANLFCSLSDSVVFENNEAFEGVIGIYVADSSDYAVVRNNRLHNNEAIGLHLNGDISSGGDGTISWAVIEGNRIYSNGATGINCDGVTWSVFRNNLIYDNAYRGIAFFQQDGAVPSNDNQVTLNTVVMPADAYYAIGFNYGATRNSFYNNILFTEGSVPCFSSTSSTGALQIQSDYNLFPTGGRIGETANGRYSLSQWQALDYDGHSFSAILDQTFEDVAQKDYRLTAGSPAVDAGTAAHSWNIDIAGQARPSGTGPDMGAYERPAVVHVSPDGLCESFTPCFSQIQEAMDWNGDNYLLKVREGDYAEDLVLRQEKRIDLQAGWNALFTLQSSVSKVQSLTILRGAIASDRLVMQ